MIPKTNKHEINQKPIIINIQVNFLEFNYDMKKKILQFFIFDVLFGNQPPLLHSLLNN